MAGGPGHGIGARGLGLTPWLLGPHPTETKAELRAEFREEIARLRIELHAAKADLIKWTFVFWVPVVLALIGLYVKP